MANRGKEAVDSFFNFSTQLIRLTISEAEPAQMVIPPGMMREEIEEPASLGQAYAHRARKQEEALMFAEAIYPGEASRFSMVESLTSRASQLTEATAVPDGGVLRRYDFGTRNFTETLPIAAHRAAILALVSTAQVVVLSGATGCGKSTQVPQYLLESARKDGTPVNIVVTQPRRIAAATLAQRVCGDRGWELGSLVGYQVGLEKAAVSEDTRLTFCTTGVLLQRLVTEKTSCSYTHIIVDEVHERTQEMDFLLVLIKKMIALGNSTVKVILMSATISVDLFSKYFTSYVADPGGKVQHMPAPIIDLDKLQSMATHNIGIFYLEDLTSLQTQMNAPCWEEPGITAAGYGTVVELIIGLNRLPGLGAVLVFLPGINEIEQLFNALSMAAKANRNLRWWIKPLHSSLTMEEQTEVFRAAPPNHRKIILATNIAESSITVCNIAYVVDYCLTKSLVCDPGSNFSSLQLGWASRSNCIQRAGRTGRTCAGRVYRLVTRSFFKELNEQETAEILRGPIERVVLLAKMLEMGSPQSVIGLAPEPPDQLAINKAVLLLKEKGALLSTLGGKPCVEDGDLTFMGRLMAKLPVDPAIGKLLLLGHAYGVLRECIVMGAAMTLKSVFSTPFQRRLDEYNSRLTWADGSCSDCVCFLNVFELWTHFTRTGYFKQPGSTGAQGWADQWLIQLKALNEVQLLVNELETRLRRMGVTEPTGARKSSWGPYEKPLVLKMVIAGAFYPNFYGRGLAGGQVDEATALREVNGLDLHSTVYLTKMPLGQPKRLYYSTIKKMLRPCSTRLRITGEPNSGRLYVTFAKSANEPRGIRGEKSVALPGRIEMGVYRAVKMRQLNIPVEVPLLRLEEAQKRATELGIYPEETFKRQEEDLYQPELPKISTSILSPLVITHREDVGHFWAQRLVPSERANFQRMEARLQDPSATQSLTRSPTIGHIYAAPYADNSGCRLYRAQLVDATRKQNRTIYEVFFIDYGNRLTIPDKELLELTPALLDEGFLRMPPAAFECVLANIAPTSVFNRNGGWSEEAHRAFNKLTNTNLLSGTVFSVVHGVVALTLHVKRSADREDMNINEFLVREGHAQWAEESQLSKRNHEARERADLSDSAEMEFIEMDQRAVFRLQSEVPSPDPEECSQRVRLSGPTSPLEMRVFGMTREGAGREVTLDGQSVNSVLLDTAPQDPHERLLVAASVSQSPRGTSVTLRQTTLLPNIHGLPALLCLAFSPCVELRTDKDSTRYTGALCGLGTNLDNKPLFPKHDMEVSFDTEFNTEDLNEINILRHQMNRCFVPERGSDSVTDDQLHAAQFKIQETLGKLLNRNRKSVPLELYPRAYTWNITPMELRVQPCADRQLQENLVRGVFQFHWGVRLRLTPEQAADYKHKIADMDMLHNLVKSGSQTESWLTCRLCNYSVADLENMADHLEDSVHMGREDQIRRRYQDHCVQTAFKNSSYSGQ